MKKAPVHVFGTDLPDYPGPDYNLLLTWRTLEPWLKRFNEEDCWAVFELEKRGRARKYFLQRIYGRASTLRAKREAREILEMARDL